MSTSPDPPARPPRAALPAGERPAEADNLPALRSPGTMQHPDSPPAGHGGGPSAMPGHSSGSYPGEPGPAGHDGSSSWFSPGPRGPQGPGAYSSGPQGYGSSGPQGYGQSAWQQGSGYSPQGYGHSGPAPGSHGAPGYGQSAYGPGSYNSGSYGSGSYGGPGQGGYGGPGPAAQGHGASGPGYGAPEPGFGAPGPGYGASGPGFGASGPGYPGPGAHSARPGDFQPPAGPPQSPPAGFGAPPPADMPDAPAPPTRAEQRPEFAPPADQSPFGPGPAGQGTAGGPRHAAPPPPPDQPQLYDAAAHEEALYRRMRSNGSNSGSHRQPGPVFTATGAAPKASPAAPARGSLGDPAFGGPARNDAPQPTQTFSGGQYGAAPSFDGPGFSGPGFGTPAPAEARRPPRDSGQKSGSGRSRVKAAAGVVGVIIVGAGLGKFVIAPLMDHGPASDPGCKAYQSTALRDYDRTVGDLNAKARQPTLVSDLTTTIGDLTTAQGSAKSPEVKTALGGLQSQLASVRTDVQKGYIPSSAVTALNNASHAADSAC